MVSFGNPAVEKSVCFASEKVTYSGFIPEAKGPTLHGFYPYIVLISECLEIDTSDNLIVRCLRPGDVSLLMAWWWLGYKNAEQEELACQNDPSCCRQSIYNTLYSLCFCLISIIVTWRHGSKTSSDPLYYTNICLISSGLLYSTFQTKW